MSPDPDKQQSSGHDEQQYYAYVDQVTRGAGVSAFGQGIGRVLAYTTQVVVAKAYGPAALGFYALGTTLVWLTSVLAQFGIDTGVVRYVAHYRAEEDVSRIRGTIILSICVTFVTSLGVATLIFLGADFLANNVYQKPFMVSVLRIFSVSLPLFTLLSITAFAIGGFQTIGGAHKHGTYVRQVFQPLINLVLIVIFYLLGARILGAGLAYVISMAIGCAIALYYLRRVFPQIIDGGTPAKYEPKALFSTSGPMVVANVMPYVGNWTALTVLGIFSTSSDVGIFNAASRTGTLSALVLFAFSGIFSPIASNLYKRGSLGNLGNLYKDVSLWAFTGSLVVFLLTVFLGRDIMVIFGPAFVPGWSALVVVAGAQLFSSSVGLTDRLLSMTGHQKIVMFATVGSTILGVAVSFVLIPIYGILGAAVATAVLIVCSNTITLLAVWWRLGFWPYDREYFKPALAGALAVSGSYLVKLALNLPPGVPTILALTPVFLAGFAVLLYALGIGPSDRRLLGTLWASIRRRIPFNGRTQK